MIYNDVVVVVAFDDVVAMTNSIAQVITIRLQTRENCYQNIQLSSLSLGSCSFESPDLCGWKDKSTGEYQWLRNRGTTPSHKTGPKVDHTCGNSSCKLYENLFYAM